MKRHSKKILLIEAPFYRVYKDSYSISKYPLALGYLAGAIKQETNWNVMAYNADFCVNPETIRIAYLVGEGFGNYLSGLKDLSRNIWKEVRSVIQNYAPDVVGISVKSQNFASSCIVARIAKEINNNTIVIVGGPHPSMVGLEVFCCPDIDIAVRGEGERTIVELLHSLEEGRSLNNVKGISHRKEKSVIENEPREYVENLDSLCFPHRDAPEVLKDYSKYPLSAFRSVFATRGCPFRCTFCGSHKIWSRRTRFRSPGNVVEEIESLNEMGVKLIHFDDDTFGVNKDYLSRLCNALIERCSGLRWSCECHVKLIDEATVALMKKSGCYSIQLGIESGNNKILSEIKKDITIEEALDACRIIKKQNIELNTFFMVGFPQETEKTLMDTVNAMKGSKSDTFLYSIFTPYPGSEAFEYCKKQGLIGNDFDVSLFNHQSPNNCFCMNIGRDRLRHLVRDVEAMIDRKNSLFRIKRLASFNTVNKIREVGLVRSVSKGFRIMLNR